MLPSPQNKSSVASCASNNGCPPRKPRACVPCHARKVRCNASEVGTPCTRCIRAKHIEHCILVAARGKRQRSSTNRKRPQDSSRTNGVNLSTISSNQSNNPYLHELSQMQENESPNAHRESQQESQHVSVSSSLPRNHEIEVESHPLAEEYSPIIEQDAHLQICQEMSRWRTSVLPPTQSVHCTTGREFIEYHGGVNSITILGEVLGQNRPKRLVRILLKDAEQPSNHKRAIPGLDRSDTEYLENKGAFDLPSRHICDNLIQLYFECVYPYAPILDRAQFMQEYTDDRHSIFLMQSLLANVVPYTPASLLLEAGYPDRLAAQKSFFSKAKLLYDFGCERGQLRLLQGSLMLGSLSFSYAMDCDFRFWLTNAVRLATQMGLHRNNMAKDLAWLSPKLHRRIWWVVYSRDVLLAVSGHDNLRRLHDSDCDTVELTEADWDESEIPRHLQALLPCIPRLQKLYTIENCKLSIISSHFIQAFRTPGKEVSSLELEQMEEEISAWKRGLPAEMHPDTVQEWSATNIWILVLLAFSTRLQAVLYRAVREHYRASAEEMAMQKAARKQQTAMFELGTIIQRVSMHGVGHLCPLSFMSCTSTLLAMRIEQALEPGISASKKLAAKSQIDVELENLRGSCEYWPSLKWTVRMFEVVIGWTGLSLINPETNILNETQVEVALPDPVSNQGDSNIGTQNRGSGAYSHAMEASFEDSEDMGLLDDNLGTFGGKNAEEWLQDLLGSSFHGYHEEDIFNTVWSNSL